MKSGIEMLEEIANKLEVLDRRLTVIEQNTKEVLNRANMLASSPKSAIAVAPAPEQAPPIKKNTFTTRVIGKISNDDKWVSGARVRVFNDKNQIVKETKTNRAGEWTCFLPVGQYGAEYFMEGLINANINFAVKDGEKIVRIAKYKG